MGRARCRVREADLRKALLVTLKAGITVERIDFDDRGGFAIVSAPSEHQPSVPIGSGGEQSAA
jgi:hypothetical protein